AIAANSQEFWERFIVAIDSEWLGADERFHEPFGRARNKDALVEELAKIFKTRNRDEWLKPLEDADVPHAPVLDYAGMSEHPQYWANGYLQNIETKHLGPMRVPGPPIQMSKTPPHVKGAGPILGINTEEILLDAGYTWEEIDAFK